MILAETTGRFVILSLNFMLYFFGVRVGVLWARGVRVRQLAFSPRLFLGQQFGFGKLTHVVAE